MMLLFQKSSLRKHATYANGHHVGSNAENSKLEICWGFHVRSKTGFTWELSLRILCNKNNKTVWKNMFNLYLSN